MTKNYKVLKQSILMSDIVGHLASSHPTHFGYRQLCPTWPVRLANRFMSDTYHRFFLGDWVTLPLPQILVIFG